MYRRIESKCAYATTPVGLCLCKSYRALLVILTELFFIEKCPQKTVFDLLTLSDLEISANVIVEGLRPYIGLQSCQIADLYLK